GGLVRLPLGQRIRVRGMPLPRDQIYGCFAETVLFGLAGIEESFSLGKLETSALERIRGLALEHRFELEEQHIGGVGPASGGLGPSDAAINAAFLRGEV